MAYSTLQIGSTGPEGRIGSGTEYHIDTKYNRNLNWEDITKRFDTKANRYGQDGRNIVFSNSGVHGTVYDPSAPLEDKIALLKKVNASHSHSVHDNFYSFDYYAPVGTDIWDKSAEGAPIYLVGAEGLTAEGGSGGGYGNYAFVTGKDGQVISKVGHGDTNLDVFKGGTFGGGASGGGAFGGGADSQPVTVDSDSPSQSTPQQEAVERVQQYKANTAKDVVEGFGNDFGSMKSQGLAAALAGAQESIIQKRMDNGEMFGGRMVEVEKPKKDDESGK